jgi:hypothetical protein
VKDAITTQNSFIFLIFLTLTNGFLVLELVTGFCFVFHLSSSVSSAQGSFLLINLRWVHTLSVKFVDK